MWWSPILLLRKLSWCNRPQWRSQKLAQNEFQKAVRTLNGHYVKRDYFRNKAENSARWCRYRAHCEVSKSAFLRTLLKRVYVFWGCEQKNRFKANQTKNSGFLFCLFIFFFSICRRFVVTEIHSCTPRYIGPRSSHGLILLSLPFDDRCGWLVLLPLFVLRIGIRDYTDYLVLHQFNYNNNKISFWYYIVWSRSQLCC